jgi:hypothetical protein
MSGWHVAFALGAASIFVVVVAVTLVLQLARRIAVQLADVSAALATIRGDTSAIPTIAGINGDTREMNEILAGMRRNLDRLVRGAAP